MGRPHCLKIKRQPPTAGFATRSPVSVPCHPGKSYQIKTVGHRIQYHPKVLCSIHSIHMKFVCQHLIKTLLQRGKLQNPTRLLFEQAELTSLLTSSILASVRAGPARQSLPNPARVERQQRYGSVSGCRRSPVRIFFS